ncbi:hypothetical protein WH47_10955 [Habropoda laboriosa]|uniref:Uncharacterized protein n=1 Tax=Habropoda laboriosa TaxID=597456 RepID=A0A0L7R9G7_9HYME|nr:hypothetical protein WH47_10955 [Habropoda laboriosa]
MLPLQRAVTRYGPGAPAVFPTGKSAAIFHCPTRQCICLLQPSSSSLLVLLSIPTPRLHRRKSVPPPCPTVSCALTPATRCRKSGGMVLRDTVGHVEPVIYRRDCTRKKVHGTVHGYLAPGPSGHLICRRKLTWCFMQ